MTVEVITTLHEDGYNLYGKDFIRTWTLYFPQDWNIVYYAEKHTPEFNKRVTVLDFDNECPEWADFYDYIIELTKNLDSKKNKKQINKYKKALRWSFKMYALLHALKNSKARYLLWLDSDVRATTSPRDNWIKSSLKDKCIAGQLEHVKGFPHVETGLLVIDMHHSHVKKLIHWIEDGYINKKILNESKPWDGAWMGKLFDKGYISCNPIRMMHLEKGNKNTAKSMSHETLRWLTHKVGDHKFTNDISGRSGRTKNSELIK